MQTFLYQLELDQSNIDCGMSYVFQLENGHFFIIDGGYFTEGEDKRLYDFLCKRSDNKPVIEAWYFSHAHQDHVGNFIQFIRQYKNGVDIKRLLYSFHPVDFSNVEGDWKSSDPATIEEFYNTIDKYCSDIEKTELQKGQELVFNELTIEVLYTYADLYPEPSSFNDYSTAIMTTVAGYKILWLGDLGRKGSEILLQCPDKLKCDIVQVSHHGIDNFENMCLLYAATEATVALWPTPDYGMVKRKNQTVNNFILNKMKIKEHLVSGYGTVKLPLPYSPGMVEKLPKVCNFANSIDNEFYFEGCENQPEFIYLTSNPVNPINE